MPSVLINGADHEEDGTENRCGAEGKNRLGSCENNSGVGSGAALLGACEPDLCVEEAASGSSGSGRSTRVLVGMARPPTNWRSRSSTPRRTIDGRARFLSQEVRKMSAPDRPGLLQRQHESLSIRRQCQLLSVARSSVYRPQRPANDNDLELMRRIDQLLTAWPFPGLAADDGDAQWKVSHQSQARAAVDAQDGYRGAGTKTQNLKAGAGQKIFPYLLRHMVIDRRIKCDLPISPMCRSASAFCIWWRSSIGRLVRC